MRERVVNPKPRARSDGLTYAKRVARWFVKNLSNANGFGALEKFVEAIKIGKNEPTKCVSIPQYTKVCCYLHVGGRVLMLRRRYSLSQRTRRFSPA